MNSNLTDYYVPVCTGGHVSFSKYLKMVAYVKHARVLEKRHTQ